MADMKLLGFTAVIVSRSITITCHLALPGGWLVKIPYCLN